MDLTSVYMKLFTVEFRTNSYLVDFIFSLNLIFDNCKLFNQPKSNMWIYADEMEERMKKEWEYYIDQKRDQCYETCDQRRGPERSVVFLNNSFLSHYIHFTSPD